MTNNNNPYEYIDLDLSCYTNLNNYYSINSFVNIIA